LSLSEKGEDLSQLSLRWRLRHEVVRMDSAEEHDVIQDGFKRPVCIVVAGFAGSHLSNGGLRYGRAGRE
jgi:hypothetical protein